MMLWDYHASMPLGKCLQHVIVEKYLDLKRCGREYEWIFLMDDIGARPLDGHEPILTEDDGEVVFCCPTKIDRFSDRPPESPPPFSECSVSGTNAGVG